MRLFGAHRIPGAADAGRSALSQGVGTCTEGPAPSRDAVGCVPGPLRVAVVTCRELPEPDNDETLLLEALARGGHRASLVPWDTGPLATEAFDVAVLRSTWNYYRAVDAFLRWIDDAATKARLVNSASIVHWNHHKRYLFDLVAQGVPIVPTTLLSAGAVPLDTPFTGDLIVKPAVSAGSYRTERFTENPAAARAFAQTLCNDGDVLVQPFMQSAESYGERSFVFIAGAFSHSIRKYPRYAGGVERVEAALDIDGQALEVAKRAVACAPEEPRYARVDMMRDGAGAFVVSELELIEPSLFFIHQPKAADAFVASLARAVG